MHPSQIGPDRYCSSIICLTLLHLYLFYTYIKAQGFRALPACHVIEHCSSVREQYPGTMNSTRHDQ
jgi:hypothetical protein